MRADTEHYMIPQQIGELAVSGTTPEYANIDLAEGTDYNLSLIHIFIFSIPLEIPRITIKMLIRQNKSCHIIGSVTDEEKLLKY